MREVMRMYVGNEPHQRILSGDVRRGEVLRIRAAMPSPTCAIHGHHRDHVGRGATDLVTSTMTASCRDRGARGEVLKFIGDGILAVFPRRREQRRRSVLAGRLARARRA